MSTWARTQTGDKVLPGIGQGATAIVTDEDECAAIRINDGLQLWLGNWAPDTSQGFPWGSVKDAKGPNLFALANLLKKAILLLGAPTVIDVPRLDLTFTSSIRDLGFFFKATSRTGATLVGGSNGPAGLPYVVTQ